MGSQPDIDVGERRAGKARQRKGGGGGKGVVAALVTQIYGVSARAANRVLPE